MCDAYMYYKLNLSSKCIDSGRGEGKRGGDVVRVLKCMHECTCMCKCMYRHVHAFSTHQLTITIDYRPTNEEPLFNNYTVLIAS